MEAVYRNHCFGIETECTGIRRDNVWKILGPEFCKSVSKYKTRKGYYNYIITDHTDRKWYVKLDSSILARRSVNGKICRVPLEEYGEYQVEFISPILEYDRDIGMLLTAIRKLKAAGAIVNKSCGIHIHLDGRKYNSHDIKNFCNIVASRTKLFDLALKAEPVRRENYCKDLDTDFLDLINKTHEVPMDKIEEAWYSKYDQEMSRDEHYHKSRYSLLNLHSFFHGHKTVELRCFNSTMRDVITFNEDSISYSDVE